MPRPNREMVLLICCSMLFTMRAAPCALTECDMSQDPSRMHAELVLNEDLLPTYQGM